MIFLDICLLLAASAVFLALVVRNKRFIVVTPFVYAGVTSIRATFLAPFYAHWYRYQPYNSYLTFVFFVAFVSFVAGYICLRRRGDDEGEREFATSEIVPKYSYRYYASGLIGTVCCLILVGVAYYRELPPMLTSVLTLANDTSLITDSTSDVRENRLALTKSHYFGGEYRGQGLLNMTQRVGWYFLIAVSLAAYRHWRDGFWALAALVTLLLGIVFIGSTGERAPVLAIGLFLIMVISFLGRLQLKHIVLSGVCLVSGLVVLSLFTGKADFYWTASSHTEGAKELTSRLAERIFVGNAQNDMDLILFVDSGALPKRMGRCQFEKIVNSIPGVRYGEPIEMTLTRLKKLPPHCFATGTYISFAYLDFGLPGVAILFFLHGALIAVAQSYLFAQTKGILTVALIALASWFLGEMLGSAGFIGLISTAPVVVVVVGAFHLCGRILASLVPQKAMYRVN